MSIDNSAITYKEEGDKYKFDLVESDLFSLKKTLEKIDSIERESIGRCLSYMMGANIPNISEDLRRIDYKKNLKISDDMSESDVLQMMESTREKSKASMNAPELKCLSITNLMSLKYIFGLDFNSSIYTKDNEDLPEKYHTDLSLKGKELRKKTYENIGELENSMDTFSMGFSLGKDLFE